MVDGDIHLFLPVIEVKSRQKVELHLLLNRNLLLPEDEHICLVDDKLSFGQLVALQVLVLHLDDMGERVVLVSILGRLVD